MPIMFEPLPILRFGWRQYKKCCPRIQKNVFITENPIVFNNYDKSIRKTTLENNGHAIMLKPYHFLNGTEISGGGLNGTYQFAQLHFHWGNSENKGSEHIIEGKAFPMEVHLVHFNKK